MNSGPQGPLSAVGLPIAESAQRFAASGPGQQSIGLVISGNARKMVDQNIKANELDWDWNK
jgi:hypothetical protein